ncbi:MAG: hypothetical protein MZW92_31320 [Comamonadaceae bacterium]|nr:hypothetical protein [Comamonadaceae bacterium]
MLYLADYLLEGSNDDAWHWAEERGLGRVREGLDRLYGDMLWDGRSFAALLGHWEVRALLEREVSIVVAEPKEPVVVPEPLEFWGSPQVRAELDALAEQHGAEIVYVTLPDAEQDELSYFSGGVWWAA